MSSVTSREPKTARFLALHTPAFQPISTSAPDGSHRKKRKSSELPGDLIPINYAVSWQPFLDKKGQPDKQFSFQGNVTITIICKNLTKEIVLHAKNLSIDEHKITVTRLNDKNSGNIEIEGLKINETREMAVVVLTESLEPGNTYSLRMAFGGQMGRKAGAGLWYSPYITEKGWER